MILFCFAFNFPKRVLIINHGRITEKRSGLSIPCSGKQKSTLDFRVHSCSERISIPGCGSGLVDGPGSQNFLGDSNIVVMDLSNLCGRLIATVWPDTSFVS